MAYKNNIPQVNDKTKHSVRDIENNWLAFQQAFSVDHVGLTLDNVGKHKWVHFPEQAPAPNTAVAEGALYTKVGVTSGQTELFFRRENNGVEIAGTEGGNVSEGWSRLFSGLIIKWGTFTVTSGTPSGTKLLAQGPAFTNIHNVSATVTLGAMTGGQFFNIMVMIPNAIPASFDWRIWKRNIANSPGVVTGVPFNISYIALGS